MILMIREGCHLCDQAFELIKSQYPDLSVELQDIDTDLAKYEQYDVRVPVLVKASLELDWPFDTEQLSHFLTL